MRQVTKEISAKIKKITYIKAVFTVMLFATVSFAGGQKSAEVIVAGRQAKLVRHSNAERRSERIGRAANRK